MSDKNDTNESLEEGQEALPPRDVETTEATEATEATGGENMIRKACLLYTSPSPRDIGPSRMPSSA